MTTTPPTARPYPEILRAMEEIDADGGGHHWRRLSGEQKDWSIPEAWQYLCAPAETGLKRLREKSEKDWSTFVCGEETEQDEIKTRQGDLEEAHQLLEAFFEGWPEATARPVEDMRRAAPGDGLPELERLLDRVFEADRPELKTAAATGTNPMKGLPEGRLMYHGNTADGEFRISDERNRIVALAYSIEFARAIAAIPGREAEIKELRAANDMAGQQIMRKDNENDHLRSLIEKMRGMPAQEPQTPPNFENVLDAAGRIQMREIIRLRAELHSVSHHRDGLEAALIAKTSELFPDLRSEIDHLRSLIAKLREALEDLESYTHYNEAWQDDHPEIPEKARAILAETEQP